MIGCVSDIPRKKQSGIHTASTLLFAVKRHIPRKELICFLL